MPGTSPVAAIRPKIASTSTSPAGPAATSASGFTPLIVVSRDGQTKTRRNRRSLVVPTRCEQRGGSLDVRSSFESHHGIRARTGRGSQRTLVRYGGIAVGGCRQAAPSDGASGIPTSIGLLAGSWLHSTHPPS